MNITSYPTREAWLNGRMDPLGVSASEAAQVLGVSPFGGPWDVYARKKGIIKPTPESQVQSRGNRWERVVLEEYALTSGCHLVAPGEGLVILQSDDHPWLRCSPDSFARQGGELGGTEAKTDLQSRHWTPQIGTVISRWEEGSETLVPPTYAVQVYVSLAISGFPWWDLCALVPTGGWPEVRWVRIMRDPSVQSEIVSSLAKWREAHLVGNLPLPVDGSDACNLMFSSPLLAKRPERLATEEEGPTILRYRELTVQIKSSEAERDLLKNQLIASAGGHRILLGPASKAYAQPQYNKGRLTIDSEKLAAEYPEAFEACIKQGNPFTTINLYRFPEDKK